MWTIFHSYKNINKEFLFSEVRELVSRGKSPRSTKNENIFIINFFRGKDYNEIHIKYKKYIFDR